MRARVVRFAKLPGCLVPAALALLLHAQPAGANSAGIFGKSGKQGQICSTTPGCHSGGTAPLVSFDGPAQLPVGMMATFHFVVQSQSASQTYAGFNVAPSDGTLAVPAGQGEKKFPLPIGEISHSTARKNDVNGQASFEFTWTAPATAGDYTLFGAGNSVKLDGVPTDDLAAAAIFVVHVTTDTVTPTPTPVPCAGDCNAGGSVTNDELLLGVAIALGTLPADACGAVDGDGDGAVTIAELLAAIKAALTTCAP